MTELVTGNLDASPCTRRDIKLFETKEANFAFTLRRVEFFLGSEVCRGILSTFQITSTDF